MFSPLTHHHCSQHLDQTLSHPPQATQTLSWLLWLKWLWLRLWVGCAQPSQNIIILVHSSLKLPPVSLISFILLNDGPSFNPSTSLNTVLSPYWIRLSFKFVHLRSDLESVPTIGKLRLWVGFSALCCDLDFESIALCSRKTSCLSAILYTTDTASYVGHRIS